MDKWDKRFMEMTEQIGKWSSCYQENRHVGAVIVKNKRIIATGYNEKTAGYRERNEARNLLCGSRRTKRYYSGGESGVQR